MNRKKRWSIILLPCLLAVLLGAHIYIAQSAASHLPKAIEVRFFQEKAISANALDQSGAVPIKTQSAFAEHEYAGGLTVYLTETNDRYPALFGLRILAGAFPAAGSTNSVAIDAKTAGELFMRYDIIGEEMTINGETFTIVGVYQGDENSLIRLSSLPKRTFFVGLSSLYQGDTLFIPAQADALIESELDQMGMLLGDNIHASETIHHAKRRAFLEQSIWLTVTALCFVFLLFLCIRFLKSDKAGLTKHWWWYLLWALLLLAVFVIALHLTWVPVDYLPEDQIFDVGFYHEAFIAGAQRANAAQSPLSFLFINTLWVLAILNLMILAVAIIWNIALLKKGESCQYEKI